MSSIRCLIIDDEELARGLIASYIAKLNTLELVGEFDNPIEALDLLKTTPIDLIFLDIQMPDLKGTDFAKMIPDSTAVIFTTAYSEYALKGFELNALDYLLKPISFERFLQAVNKFKPKQPLTQETITVKSGYDLYKIQFDDILYIESANEYVIFHTNYKKIMSYQTLKSTLAQLPDALFMRVHRSFVVNTKKITALKGRELFILNHKSGIPVSERYLQQVKEALF